MNTAICNEMMDNKNRINKFVQVQACHRIIPNKYVIMMPAIMSATIGV